MMGKEEKKYFFEKLYGGEEIVFTVFGKKYFIQGYYKENAFHFELQLWVPEEKTLWKTSNSHMYDCVEEFLDAPLFDGKTFWDIETEMQWVDE